MEYGDGYVAGGWIETTPGDRRFALVRWNGVGTPDAGFVVRDRLDAGDDEIGALAVDPQQRIVAAGRSGARIGVARYGSNGVRDAGVQRRPRLHGPERRGGERGGARARAAACCSPAPGRCRAASAASCWRR